MEAFQGGIIISRQDLGRRPREKEEIGKEGKWGFYLGKSVDPQNSLLSRRGQVHLNLVC